MPTNLNTIRDSAANPGVTSPQPVWLDESRLAEWDAYVHSHPAGTLYHGTAWKRVLEGAFSQIRGRIMVLEEPDSRRICGGLPVYEVTSRWLGTRWISAPFASYVDPLVDANQSFREILFFLRNEFFKSPAKTLEIKLNGGFAEEGCRGYQCNTSYFLHVIQLDSPVDDVLKRCSKTAVQHMVRKGRQGGVKVRSSCQFDDLNDFYQIYKATRKRLCLPATPYRFFRAIHDELMPMVGRIFLAELDGRPVATALTLLDQRNLTIEYAGDLAPFRKSGCNQVLYWEIIRYARSVGCSTVGLGRTFQDNYGLLEYKRRWKPRESRLTQLMLHKGKSRTSVNEQLPAYTFMRHLLRWTPGPCYPVLSNFIYRHHA